MRTLGGRQNLVRALEVDPGLDEVLGEDSAREQELVVVLEGNERLFERTGNLRDALGLLGGSS